MGFAGLSATAIVVEAGFTVISTTAVGLIALLTTVAVFAGGYAEKNKRTMGRQRARRTTSRSRSRRSSGSRSGSRSGRHRQGDEPPRPPVTRTTHELGAGHGGSEPPHDDTRWGRSLGLFWMPISDLKRTQPSGFERTTIIDC